LVLKLTRKSTSHQSKKQTHFEHFFFDWTKWRNRKLFSFCSSWISNDVLL